MTVAGGIVLAGGRSRRMGRPKADLDWHGKPLVAHVAGVLGGALGGPVVVVGAPGQVLPDLPAGVLVARDAAEGRGPLQGLVAGLRRLEAEGARVAVAVATDQPLITPGLLRRVLAALEAGRGAAAFEAEGRLQPLGAAYRVALAGEAEQRLAAGDGSLQGLLRAAGPVIVEATPAEAAQLRSLDTPEAYAAALRASAG